MYAKTKISSEFKVSFWPDLSFGHNSPRIQHKRLVFGSLMHMFRWDCCRPTSLDPYWPYGIAYNACHFHSHSEVLQSWTWTILFYTKHLHSHSTFVWYSLIHSEQLRQWCVGENVYLESRNFPFYTVHSHHQGWAHITASIVRMQSHFKDKIAPECKAHLGVQTASGC